MQKKEAQAILLAHYKSPQGMGEIGNNYLTSKGANPLCGDEITVGALVEEHKISDIKFQARACSICIASSSIMVKLMLHNRTDQIEYFFEQLHRVLKEPECVSEIEELLKPLASISAMPSRHKCAQLCWEALSEACQSK